MLHEITLCYDIEDNEIPTCLKTGLININSDTKRIKGILYNSNGFEYLFGSSFKNNALEFTIAASNGELYDFQLLSVGDGEYAGIWQHVDYNNREFNNRGKVKIKIECKTHSISDYEKLKKKISQACEYFNASQAQAINRLNLNCCGTLKRIFDKEEEEEESELKK